ncbi:MAG: class I SAM-dependent methyltransferase [Desulfomicrobium sp.]|nr:class I SAM-dependent methyltransferase [Pseudomonadota bacterium]MBV1713015.1 class I SAM-dependent methyltransferase [Desulfomicrobium sp.]MBU4571985.1 class I SAM-dependent methyltransferase [Pseudomonadota bacterium]MBU4596134.1 class I SAM-dependent methyltransferase [Pseudomonadota bacterium]MBV1721438.1 class I SAM-dependent methyltransferase [Desulfomicrobium sp.]
MSVNAADMIDFFAPAGIEIETLTPSAWGGHIPFMLCLMNFIRPKTYVELGTHYGASFFAVCQAVKFYDIECHPTAVDLWIGDEHAGVYDESVYNDFTWIFNSKYGGVGTVLREDFNKAVENFENKSIDLLHIDGLHTYEAVKNDYTVWLPKVSDNGIILFHDTCVRDRGFGVWKFWDEIKDCHASFNFQHTHGLGVIAFGSREDNALVSILEEVNSSSNTRESFEYFFANCGRRAVNEALRKFQAHDPLVDFINKVRSKDSYRKAWFRVVQKFRAVVKS